MEDSKNLSRTRRNFSIKFKSDLVLEVLKGEKEMKFEASGMIVGSIPGL